MFTNESCIKELRRLCGLVRNGELSAKTCILGISDRTQMIKTANYGVAAAACDRRTTRLPS